MEWKTVIYKAYVNVIQPKLAAKVASTESKIDDVMVKGLDSCMDAFFKPKV